MKDEIDFLRWLYHGLRLKSGDSVTFEREMADLYTWQTGKTFPYHIPDGKHVS